MAKEQLEAEVVVSIDQGSLKQSEQEMKRLQSPEAIKMSIDLGALRRQLDVMKGALREAVKAGDIDLANKLGGQVEILKKQITGLNRELTNFVRTGDKEVSVLGKMFQQVGVDINSGFGKVLAAISGSFAQGAANAMNRVGLGATDLGKRLQQVGADAEKSGTTIGNLFGKGAILAGVAAVGVAVFQLGKQALFLGDKYEQASLSFGVMLGSGEKAKNLLADLSLFASKTPFEIQGIRDSAKQLLAFGISSDSIVGTLKALGDVASGTGTPLEQIAYAYGQVRTANQLYGTELRQFVNAGVPLLGELAKMYGVTESKVKKMVENGEIGFNDVQQAFVNMTSEGGKFFNMMGVQSTTLTGKVSNLKDQFTLFLEEIGTALLPTAKMFVDATSWMFKQFRNSLAGMQIITTILTAYVMDRFYAVKSSFVSLITFIRQFGIIWNGIFAQLGNNVAVMVQNVGIAFDNLPSYIQYGLNKALGVMNVFFQSAEQAFIDLGTLFGKEWKLAKGLDLTIDLAGPAKAYEEFGSAQLESAMTQVKALEAQKDAYKDSMTEMQDINKVALKEYLTDATDQTKNARELNYNLSKVAEDSERGKDKSNKKAQDALKKAEKEKQKIYEDSIKFQKKVFENAIKLREDDLKATEEYIGKIKKALKDINDVEKEIANVGKDAGKQTTDATGDRYRELLSQQKDAQKELESATREYGAGLVAPEQKRLDAIIAQIKELENSGLLDQNTKAKEQQRASLTQEGQARFDFQDKLGQIAIDKANKQAELQQKKKEIEDELGLSKYQAEQGLIIQQKRKDANEKALTKYHDIIALIEKGITENTGKEIDRRMSLYAQEEQRLLRLIELRTQAGYAVGAISQPASNTTNNSTTNVNVNASIANNVDIDQVARDFARKIQTSNKTKN